MKLKVYKIKHIWWKIWILSSFGWNGVFPTCDQTVTTCVLLLIYHLKQGQMVKNADADKHHTRHTKHK